LKKFASLLILAALVLSACGGGSNATVATVDGEDITLGEVEALIDPGEESTIAKELYAQFLGFDIQQRIVVSAAEEDLGIVVADEEITAEADAIFEEANTEGVSREDFLATNGITEDLLSKLAHQQLLDGRVRESFADDAEDPTQEEIDIAMEQAALGLAEVCASHILVATEEEANDVLDRIDAGEEFADLAVELSLDTASGAEGGVLECTPPIQYVLEFADAAMAAEIGVATEPVESEFGFHIIVVSDRTEADPAELPADEEIVEQLRTVSVGTIVNEWFTEQIELAEVTVDESYGTWQASPVPQVTPPTE